MKVEFIEVSGFRGFRRPFRVEVPAGFLVISGRNGTGKSTICDAIEFAITGTIAKYRFTDSGRESLSDYLWYRGSGSVESYFVRVGFSSRDGRFILERTRSEGLVNTTEDEVIRRFTKPEIAPEAALEELCRTSIVRDELISALSMDMKGTELFQQVSNALGGIDSSKFERKAATGHSAASATLKQVQEHYGRVRNQLEDALSELTRIRDSGFVAADVSAAMKTLEMSFPDLPEDISQRLSRARSTVAKSRITLDALARAADDARDLSEESLAIRTGAFTERESAVAAQLASLREANVAAQATVDRAEFLMVQQREANRLAADLSATIEAGRRAGLIDERCPLCSTELRRVDFEHGLVISEEKLKALNDKVQAIDRELHQSNALLRDLRAKLAETEHEVALIKGRISAIKRREQDLRSRFQSLGYEINTEALDVQGLIDQIARDRDNLAKLDQATRILEASQSVNILLERESRVTALRGESREAEKRLVKSQKVEQQLKDVSAAVIRTRNEMRLELLAQIGPLLEELYQRLNPHIDWRKIEYKLRGDVRRFLTFRVGEDLNPQFIFSSGQRRAAGLAFLLSVSLSRQWSRWETLILDDPVQHIDDYRALNLIEILSAIRRSDKQVICTAEDDSLAALLCRRLRSTQHSGGARLDFDMSPEDGLALVRREDITPLSPDVLGDAKSIRETA